MFHTKPKKEKISHKVNVETKVEIFQIAQYGY